MNARQDEATLPGFERQRQSNPEKIKTQARPKAAKSKLPARIQDGPRRRAAVAPQAKTSPAEAPDSRYQLVAQLAANRKVPAEKMRQLLDMLKEEERLEAERHFDFAMFDAQRAMPPIPRDSWNNSTKSWWARIEGVSEKMNPIIRQYGFTISWGMGESHLDEHYRILADVTWRGLGAGGKRLSFSRRYEMDIGRDDIGPKGTGTKTRAQGSVSVMTYGRRVLKMSIFDVVPLGMDRDGNSEEPAGRETITAPQLKDLRGKLRTANINEESVCEFYRIDKLDHLAADQLEGALQRVADKQALLG